MDRPEGWDGYLSISSDSKRVSASTDLEQPLSQPKCCCNTAAKQDGGSSLTSGVHMKLRPCSRVPKRASTTFGVASS